MRQSWAGGGDSSNINAGTATNHWGGGAGGGIGVGGGSIGPAGVIYTVSANAGTINTNGSGDGSIVITTNP